MRRRRAMALLVVAASCVLTTGPVTAAKAPKPPAHRLHLPGLPAAAALSTMSAPSSDVTGDGRADAVARDRGIDSGTLRVYAHNGATTGNPWISSEDLDGNWDFADTLLLGDVNGDGRSDIVARDPVAGNGTLWIQPQGGQRYSAGTGWNKFGTLLLGDVTGDGRADLLAREQGVSAGTLWIHRHSGSTTGNPWTEPKTWAGTGWNLANVMLLDDVTRDGHRDIVVRDGSGAAWIYPHDGVRTGNPYTSRYFAGSGWQLAKTMLLGDANADTRPDLVAVDGNGELFVYPHNGSAPTANPYTTRYSAGTGWTFADRFLLTDANGDGKSDIVARLRKGDLWVYPHNGQARPWESRFSAGTHWTFENLLMLGDVTGDRRSEIVARDSLEADGTLWIYPHNGSTDPTSDPWTAARVPAGTGWNFAVEMVLGDLTGDGWSDLLVRDRGGDLWIYPHNRATSGHRWTAARQWAGSGWDTAAALALGDVNGDGRVDLVDKEVDGSLWIHLTGSSGDPINVPGDWRGATTIAVANVRGDDRPDLIVRESGGGLMVYPHNGSSSGNPWTTREFAGGFWSSFSAVLF